MAALLKIAFAAILPVLMGSCQTVENKEAEVEPKPEITEAVLTQKSAEAHKELEDTVSKAMGGRKVTLATEILMGESTFSVQQIQQMGPDGNPIMGRIMERPDKFTLHTDGKSCTLTHEKSGNVFPLTVTTCERVVP
ncbi:MAG: hypothetical protein EX271_04160 [Acidimicrobiales bacterium]|nr:hypothetical protein [Hyphomonadaceae bacterium]RZV43290.1 MAG: hypothetical protein EX271_04160 [Acidimicrobiales bacterium]